jgi:hypothetical protein
MAGVSFIVEPDQSRSARSRWIADHCDGTVSEFSALRPPCAVVPRGRGSCLLGHSGRREAPIRNLARLKKIPGSPLRGAPE